MESDSIQGAERTVHGDMFDDDALMGLTVLWYPKADISKRPFVGMVIGSNSSGAIDLRVFQKNGNAFVVKASFHRSRKGDLYGLDGRTKTHVRQSGCWEMTPSSRFIYESSAQQGYLK